MKSGWFPNIRCSSRASAVIVQQFSQVWSQVGLDFNTSSYFVVCFFLVCHILENISYFFTSTGIVRHALISFTYVLFTSSSLCI